MIKDLLGKSLSCSEISRAIGRARNTVIAEVRRNGGRFLYDPIIAEERYLKGKQERVERCRLIAITGDPQLGQYKILETRIQNLEMQIEILVDMIKELRNES